MPFVKDPLRDTDRAEVYARDGGCIAPLVDPEAGPCRDQRRRIIHRSDPRGRTIDHVPPTLGATRISKPRWMVWLCWGHHAHPSYWETAHRQEERDYLARKYGDLSMATRQAVVDQIATTIDVALEAPGGSPSPDDLAAKILERLSLEDHLLLAEELLSKATAGTITPSHAGIELGLAHKDVTSAIDHVSRYLLTVGL